MSSNKLLTMTALILSGKRFATKVAPAVEKADAPTAERPLTIKQRTTNWVSSSIKSRTPNNRLHVPHRKTPQTNINFGPIEGRICPMAGDVQKTING